MLWAQAGLSLFVSHVPRMMPFAELDLLQHDLWATLWWMDGQPPGFNLLLGLALQTENPLRFLQVVFWLCGAALSLGVYGLARVHELNTWLATALAVGFAQRPATLLLENYAFHTYPTAAVLCVACVLFAWALRSQRRRAWILFWTSLAAACWIRSAIHVGIFVPILGATLLSCRSERRRILATAAIPLLIALLPYAKNLALYGSFSSSSWLGANLAGITTQQIPEATRRTMVERGDLSPLAMVPRFAPIATLRAALPDAPQPTSSHPLRTRETKKSGDVNYHHAVYSHAARQFLADAWRVITEHPAIYARGISRAFVRLSEPASRWQPLTELRAIVGPLGAFEDAVTSATHLRVGESFPGITLIVIPLLLAAFLFRALAWLRRRSTGELAKLLPLGLIVYVVLVSTLLDFGENQRFRYLVDALLCVETIRLAQNAWNIPSRRGRRRGRLGAALGRLGGTRAATLERDAEATNRVRAAPLHAQDEAAAQRSAQ